MCYPSFLSDVSVGVLRLTSHVLSCRISGLLPLALVAAIVAGCATEAAETAKTTGTAKAAESATKTARPPSIQQQVQDAYAAATKGIKSVNFKTKVEKYREVRALPPFATNAVARLLITEEIVSACRVPGMHTIHMWDKKLHDEIPAETKLVLDDPAYDLLAKLKCARWLAEWYASENEDFKTAEKLVRDLIAAYPKARDGDVAQAELLLCDIYKWQDRFADAWAVLERLAELGVKYDRWDIEKAGRKAIDIAADDGSWDKVRAIWAKTGDEANELACYASGRGFSAKRPPDYLERAKAYVRNPANPLASRARLVLLYFCGDRTPEQRELRALVKDADFSKAGLNAQDALLRAYQFADYELALELLKMFEKTPGMRLTPVELKRMTVVSLGAVGRKDEAIALAEKSAAEEGVQPLDKARFLASAAVLKGEDVGKVVAAAKLSSMDEAAVWRTASRQALIWGNSPVAEKCAAEHEKHFAEIPKRAIKVAWFDEPLVTIADWRKVHDKLDRQYCDLKFRMSMEDLVTDVATGRRSVEESALDSEDARMELTTTCDRMGFHIFLRVEDPNARAIENGFASGMATEMYLAPGANQPYVCFGTSPTEGVQYGFQTTYSNLDHQRPDVMGRKNRTWFRSETAFTDTDYVLHLFFAWENFYQKLPADGTAWKYDCLSWTPKGAYNWAGSQGPHSCSAWGDLVFSLTPAEITSIRRGLLGRTRRGWRQDGKLDIFEKWADAAIGDPAFYEAMLKPLEKELAESMKGVTPDTSDAEVNRIFELALAKCRGIRHEIDARRQLWLRRQLTD